MPIIETKLNPRSDDFRNNAVALEALVADLRAKVEHLALGCLETVSLNCSIRVRRSWNCRSWPRSACITTTRRAPV
jgi:hypothetical protein